MADHKKPDELGLPDGDGQGKYEIKRSFPQVNIHDNYDVLVNAVTICCRDCYDDLQLYKCS